MFIDKAKIVIRSGDGGYGIVSFLKEKSLELGGPNGGNGGHGGSVYIKGSKNLTNLAYFYYKQHFFANNGERGGSANCTGKTAENLIIEMPFGTVIHIVENGLTFEVKDESLVLIAMGGIGGVGNAQLKNSKDRAPHYSRPPSKGTEFTLELQLKIIADVGLVGMPNAGKSSFLNAFTNANARVEPFPFSTVHPVLGTYKLIKFIDIPGLVEDAHMGKGMGIKFLQHIERCKYLLVIVDINNKPLETLQIVFNELKIYGINIPHMIILNKCDLINKFERNRIIHIVQQHYNCKVMFCSAMFNNNIKNIVNIMHKLVILSK